VTPLCLPFVLFFFVFTYWIDKYLIMYFYEKGHELDGRVVNTVADVTSYYLNAFPIYIMVIIPTLFTVWKTWILLIPFLIVLLFALRALDRYSKGKEIDKIVVGIKKAALDEEQDTEDVMNNENSPEDGFAESPFDSTYSSNTMTNIEDEEENYAPVRTRSPNTSSGFASSVLSTIRTKSIGPESRLTNQEIESLVSPHHIARMANRYKHPYLRKQVTVRKQDLSEQF
jgi:hypothetical protein